MYKRLLLFFTGQLTMNNEYGKRGAEKVHEMALKYHKDYKTYFIGSVVNSLFDVLTEQQVIDYVTKRIKKGI